LQHNRFQAKRLVALLGAPGSGKTSLANQIAETVARKRPVLYVTSEDSPDVLIAKTLSRIGDVKYSAVLYGWTGDAFEKPTKQAIEMWKASPSSTNLHYLDVTSGRISMEEVRERAKAHFEGKPGPGLIVIDYLQRMARAIRENTNIKELREAVTTLTERLRAIACDLDCTVLAVASMNRASGYNRNNDALSASKESGDVEYTCDVLMALTDDSTEKEKKSSATPTRILRIDKNRQGEVTTLRLNWIPDRQTFADPNAREEGV
jgi:replicative DNA helicase